MPRYQPNSESIRGEKEVFTACSRLWIRVNLKCPDLAWYCIFHASPPESTNKQDYLKTGRCWEKSGAVRCFFTKQELCVSSQPMRMQSRRCPATAVLFPRRAGMEAGEGAGSLLPGICQHAYAHASARREQRGKNSSGRTGNLLGLLGICNQIKWSKQVVRPCSWQAGRTQVGAFWL